MTSHVGGQAIVVGAGIAGLVAARALADHFDKVLLLERDRLPADAAHRSGVPQSRHVHGLMMGGMRALGDLFPGLEQHLTRGGAVPIDFTFDKKHEVPRYDLFPRRKLDIITYQASRPLIELTIRELLQSHVNVTVAAGRRVQDIVATSDGGIVTGVRCETEARRSDTLSADLVIDATGRGAITLEMLKSYGRPLPVEASIGMGMGYSSAAFRIPDDARRDWKAVSTMPDPPRSSRGAFLFPLEDNQWILTLFGMHGEKPPGDWHGFLDFARNLRTQTIYNAISQAERIGEIHRFSMPASVRRYYEQLDPFPRGLLPIGDAISRFNPVFGQGMTVAAMEALHLNRVLSVTAGEGDPLSGLAARYFAGARNFIDAAWSTAVLDLVYPETSGSRPSDFVGTLRFGAGIRELAFRDPAVHKLMMEVQHLLKPSSVFRTVEFVQRIEAVNAE